MATTKLQIDYTQFQEHVALLMGWDRDPDNWSSQRREDVDRVIQSGLQRVYNCGHRWGFLRPRGSLTVPAPYATGTVTIAADSGGSVVTLAGGTWPAWAASGELVVDGTRYTVLSRNSGTEILLELTDVTVATATAFTLSQYRFDLPDDFGGLDGPVTYDAGATNMRHELHSTHESVIRQLMLLESRSLTSLYPQRYAIYVRPHDLTTAQTWVLEIFPPAAQQVVLHFCYRSHPVACDTDNPYPLGGGMHSETFLEAILAEAEVKLQALSREHSQRFPERLAASIKLDKEQRAPEFLPTIRNPMTPDVSDEFGDVYPWCQNGLTTYEGHDLT